MIVTENRMNRKVATLTIVIVKNKIIHVYYNKSVMTFTFQIVLSLRVKLFLKKRYLSILICLMPIGKILPMTTGTNYQEMDLTTQAISKNKSPLSTLSNMVRIQIVPI